MVKKAEITSCAISLYLLPKHSALWSYNGSQSLFFINKIARSRDRDVCTYKSEASIILEICAGGRSGCSKHIAIFVRLIVKSHAVSRNPLKRRGDNASRVICWLVVIS